jgi:hypothetical protein
MLWRLQEEPNGISLLRFFGVGGYENLASSPITKRPCLKMKLIITLRNAHPVRADASLYSSAL